ncbi:hypothetical protein H5410_002507 [Solanum commersonii]|uniref:Putative plant transposon protein domain-containing protein n=1 Tax=Solanum commersonii TaxID=4109 RepID=A0A9J6B244_SOLCO|nr:hypothetical protein H5410_002507 [Solanum commersonii]
MAKIWQDQKKYEYSGMIGSMGLVYGELFNELGRACHTIRRSPTDLRSPFILVYSVERFVTFGGHVRGRRRVPSTVTPPTTEPVPLAPPSVDPTLPVAPPLPRLLNRLKGDGLQTILEEKLLLAEGLEGKHDEARRSSVTAEHINIELGQPLHLVLPYLGFSIVPDLDDLKGWLALMISDITPRRLDAGSPIEKRDMNIGSRYWFGFMSSTIMPSQNESIMRHPKAACLGDGCESQIDIDIPAISCSRSTSITELCRHAGVPRDPASDIEVTLSSSTDIRHIVAKFTQEENDRRRAALDTSPKRHLHPPRPLSPQVYQLLLLLPHRLQPARITQAIILKMRQLAYSADVRSTRLERSIPKMIDMDILAALTPHSDLC